MTETTPALTTGQQRALDLFNELWSHPDPNVRNSVRKAAKDKYPDVTLPVDEIEPLLTPLRAENKDLRDAIEKLQKDNEERSKKESEQQTFRQMESQVDSAVREYGLTDEGKAKMLERMKETGNYTDPVAAAAWVASKAPPPAQPNPTWAPQSMNLFGSQEKDEQFAALHRNPEKYLDDQLIEFVKNPDKYVADTFGQ